MSVMRSSSSRNQKPSSTASHPRVANNASQMLGRRSSPLRRRSSPLRHGKRTKPLLGVTIETSIKLAVNAVLSAIAVTILAKALPSHLAQQERLHDIYLQVEQAETRVSQLQADFSNYFDPAQESSTIQNQLNYIKPQQRRIIWVQPR